ncbi:Rho1 guanine nucleotide exchange factor 3 [Podosphaera aphanis]|nr:Rho1 guanine nucleotide exchange factor 3 [Podosphaera aphanis]
MSFHSSSPRRYGHVPPVQYRSPSRQESNIINNGRQKKLSFDTLDDLALFNSDRFEPGAQPVSGRSPFSPSNDICIPSPVTPYRHQSPRLEPYGKTSPVLSDHEYMPFPVANQSPSIHQTRYNPQNFVATQNISEEFQSQSHLEMSPSTVAPLSYNPAFYQMSQSPVSQEQHQTLSGSNSFEPYPYNSEVAPLSQSNWRQGVDYYRRIPMSSWPSQYGPQTTSPTSSTSFPSPSQQKNYIPDSHSTAYYAENEDYPCQNNYRPAVAGHAPYSESDIHTSQRANFHVPLQENFNSPLDYTIDSLSQSASDVIDGREHQRHPTSRPLPSAPVQMEHDINNWETSNLWEENVGQEQLFADIGDALRASGSRRQRPLSSDQLDRDLLDGELYAHEPLDSQALNLRESSELTDYDTTSNFNHIYDESLQDLNADDNVDNESDLEAEAGLEALRIAEEQDSYGGIGSLSFGNYERRISSPPPFLDESSDGSENLVDLGAIGGGFDARMSYGEEDLIKSTGECSSDEMDKKNFLSISPKPKTSNFHTRTPSNNFQSAVEASTCETYTFPNVDDARVDTFGTGGLQSPTFKSHRLSFDEGDEQVSLYSHISGGSESESPSRGSISTFYQTSADSSNFAKSRSFERPLPLVPSKAAQPFTGAYQNQIFEKLTSLDSRRNPHMITGQNGYIFPHMLQRSGQNFPRSSSLYHHGSVPYTAPPVRSKTDAEERQARQKASRTGIRSATGLDSYDIGGPQILHAIDLPSLPAGRQKKFCPSRLSTADFSKCKEPWALSSIASWIRNVAGGETGEGEPDLRVKIIEEGLVALFTHKVPTMNTADAENLSQRVTQSMLECGILVREEEWVKFGPGEISGVLWQLIGSGCYSPKLHEHEIPGRCYSHHCTRTLKKVNLLTHILEPSRKSEDWITFFKLTKEQLEGTSKKEIQRQNNLHEIIMSEDLYMDHLNILEVLYRDELLSWQPPIIAQEKLPKFISSVFGKVEAIKAVNESYLLAQLKYRQKEQGPWIIGFSDIFREWIRKAKTVYVQYAAGFPHARYLVRREADKNILFRQFLDQARNNKLSGRLDWNTYLKAPITRLQRYGLLLGTVLNNMTQDTEEKANLAIAIEEIKAVTLECDAKVDEESKKVEMLELRSKLYLRPGMNGVELNLDHLGRKIIYQGDLQRAGANRFTWLETRAILLDNYLILAKTVSKGETMAGRKREAYDVSKLPIPMQLLVLESTNDDPVVKSSVKGLSAVTAVSKTAPAVTENAEKGAPLQHTTSNQLTTTSPSMVRLQQNMQNDNDTRLMYPFRIKHLGKAESYTLYAPTAQNRLDWCEKILEAKTRHTTSLHEQNAEPFRLRVMADSAFALDSISMTIPKSNSSVAGTPLDRAIREIENIYGAGPRPGPVCRAQVNCATTFNCHGKTLVAIGTDYGVYISEEANPRGWTRSISISRVTQISVLEDFSLCLIIADKALIAYHLEIVFPASGFPAPSQESTRRAPQKLSGTRDVSFFATARMKDRTLIFYKKREGLHSTFKVLEPVFQKSTEKLSRLLGKLKGGTTEFFRAYDEFYIPSECYTINIFHSYIAISTLKGFELMTLDKKLPMSIPDVKDPAISNITARLTGQKPLGMFRLSQVEFLLCYEECGVYVDKHGDVSRSVVLEFVGKAKTAAMYGAYLVLFDTDFVEVRNAENGRLRQVISGKDIKCLDCGVNPLGVGSTTNNKLNRKTLKFSMLHPEVNGRQIVLEMKLNEGHSE